MPSSKSVLLIDDCRNHGFFIERAFSQLKVGISLFHLLSGEDAIEHLLRCPQERPAPDLVLLDRDMPGGMDGFETLAAIRALRHLQTLPVLVITGSDDDAHIERARAVGADGYAIKPVDQQLYADLARQIHAWSPQESWRNHGGSTSELRLVVPGGGIVLSGKSMPDQTLSAALPVEPNLLIQAANFFRDLVRQTFDPVELVINEACRRHHIPPAHARGRAQDQVTVANRHAVILDVMEAGFGDKVILENFCVSQRQIERLRATWRGKRGGVLADGAR